MIAIENLSFQYGTQKILEQVSLKAHAGEILCLLGPNGAGKTTLLKCLLGITKSFEGEIRINQDNLRHFDSRRLARQLSYVPQKQTSSFPYSVLDMVVMGRTSHLGLFSTPKQVDYDLALQALDAVGLSHLSDRPFTKVSGGESQLIMIARSMTQESKCIVLDEPTAHLDFRNELVILERIKSLVMENNKTVVMATHYPNHAFYFENHGVSTKVAFLNEGRIQFYGSPKDVLTESNLESIYQIESKVLKHEDLTHVIPLYTKGSR